MAKILRCKGKVDYDYKYDILFFRSPERNYAHSIEFGDLILDIDDEGFIVGIQILDASKFLDLKKSMLLKAGYWEFKSTVNEGKIELRLVYQVVVRNKVVEKNPIILETSLEPLPDSELICRA